MPVSRMRGPILALLVFSLQSLVLAAPGGFASTCVVLQMRPNGGADLRGAHATWLAQNESNMLVRFVKPWALRNTSSHALIPSLPVWQWALRWLPRSCEWFMMVPIDSYVHLKLVRQRLQCLLEDPTLKYLGFLHQELPAGAPQIPVADARAGIVLRRSLLGELPQMLQWCSTQHDFQELLSLGEDILLGVCLSRNGVHLASYLDPTEVRFEDFNLQKSGSHSNVFHRVMSEFLANELLALMKCLMIVSGLQVQEMHELHRLIGKSSRWHPGVACLLDGLVRDDAMHGIGPLQRPVLEPAVRSALRACFLSRAFHKWQSGERAAHRPVLAQPQALAKEWIEIPPGKGKAFDRLRKGGHKVCVFVLTTSATEKHRDDARAVYATWATSRRPPGVEVFMVKDNSWSLDPGGEEADDVLTLPGDVDLGFLYNSVRSFLLWRHLAANHPTDCEWFVKVDADTFLNLWALEERLRRYFNASEKYYLGSVKTTLIKLEQSQSFAVNTIVLSRALLSNAGTILSFCFDNILWRRLGQGAEDVDLGVCLNSHANIVPVKLGAAQEMPSRNFAASMTGSVGGGLLNASGKCTLLIHPVHAPEMYELHTALTDRRNKTTASCDWPEDQVSSGVWSNYMEKVFNKKNDHHQCWDIFFNWKRCCDEEMWGPTGNLQCWDDENSWQRCCNRTDAKNDRPRLASTTTSTTMADEGFTRPSDASTSERLASRLGLEVFHVKNPFVADGDAASIVALAPPEPQTKGNPKCWQEGFSYDFCCYFTSSTNCWTWPFSFDFCCYTPLAPRPPIIPGSRALGRPREKVPRTSRCQDVEDTSLLACQMSLDEIGILFELHSIGTGDKASGWHDYLGVYERFLLPMPLHSDVLEFGVRMGASLAMWSEYFPTGTVVGIDKNLATFWQHGQPLLNSHGAFSIGNVYVLEGNASDVSGREKLQGMGFDHFDVMVDDANHWAKDQIARFELYFPEMLRPGGTYLIEDVHMAAPFDRDGLMVREYFANLTASVYVADEILVGAHQIRNKRQASKDWRHKVESVTFTRDIIAIAKAADAA